MVQPVALILLVMLSPVMGRVASNQAGASLSPWEWRVLGPFTSGKLEGDGDPVAAQGGILSVYPSDKRVWISELAQRGRAKWWKVRPNGADGITSEFTPRNVDWNRLVQTIGDSGVLEWQGWAVGSVVIPQESSYTVECHGAAAVYIKEGTHKSLVRNGSAVFDHIISGDVYWSGSLRPVEQLRKGHHTLFVRLRAKVSARWRCVVQPASDWHVIAPSFVPDVLTERGTPDASASLASTIINVPIQNSQDSWLRSVEVVPNAGLRGATATSDGSLFDVAPGQTYALLAKLQLAETGLKGCPVPFTVTVRSGKETKSVSGELRCRSRRNSSFRFTYKDHDGSLGVAAAVPPVGHTCQPKADGCSVVLSLHGTGVSAEDQADSHKLQTRDGKWVFGVKNAWVVAPSRHGAHNWESTGHLSAMESITALSTLTVAMGELASGVNSVIFFGHSMGGHGAWNAAVRHPDRVIGVISNAGWIKKEYYSDANLLFVHDVSVHRVDTQLKAVVEGAVADAYADTHAINIAHKPILARVGGNDPTVPPWQVRRMARVLSTVSNVTYSEVAGKEHWWWDTDSPSDGGCMNDKEIRSFLSSIVENDASPEPNTFDLVVSHVGGFSSRRGIQILQPVINGRRASMRVTEEGERMVVQTHNVRVFSVVKWGGRQLPIRPIIDGSLGPASTSSAVYTVCRDEDRVWYECNLDSIVRSADQFGPARIVHERPFKIVFLDKFHLHHAVYFANMHYLTTHATVPVAESLPSSGGAVLIITADKLASVLAPSGPRVWIDGVGLHVGPCVFSGPRVGAAFTAPLKTGALGLVFTGVDEQGILDAVALGVPTIPPMARAPYGSWQPEWLVTGPTTAQDGVGGLLAAGWWGYSWGFLHRSAYAERCF